ncbi:hypothetical protein [Coleofasciculus sp. E2-BRE-01]|jgi:hypothetical protein
MLKPNCPPGELTYQQGYQQALEDFAIAKRVRSTYRASVHPPFYLL